MDTCQNKFAIVACSNPYNNENKIKLNNLIRIFSSLNIDVVISPYIFKDKTSAKNKGNIFMEYMLDPSIKTIFDISGGDLCNEALEFIDFKKLRNNKTLYCGYSDNSVLLNSLYSKSNIQTLNYQINRLIGEDAENQLKYFKDTFLNNLNTLTSFNYSWVSEKKGMRGIVLGGNLRCTLKLAGTEYFPDFKNSILFLESLGGDENKIKTYLTQFKQIGAFSNLKGIILGEFTELQKSNGYDAPFKILKSIVDISNIPIIQTMELGHSPSSKGIFIGSYQIFS